MSAKAIVAGEVAVEAKIDQIGKAVGDLEKLTKSMTKVEVAATKASKGFSALKFLVALNVVQRNIGKAQKWFMSLVDAIDLIDKGSQRLGLTAQRYRELSAVAQLSGASIEQFETAFISMQRNIGNLALSDSGGEAAVAFEKLGLTFEKLSAMAPDDRLYTIAGALEKFETHADKSALAMKIFGESGMKLMPMLLQGEDALRSFGSSMGMFLGTISEEDRSKFVQFKDTLFLWNESLLAVKATIGAQVLPVFSNLMAAVVGTATAMRHLNEESATAGRGDSGGSIGDLEALTGAFALAAGLLNIALQHVVVNLTVLGLAGTKAIEVMAKLTSKVIELNDQFALATPIVGGMADEFHVLGMMAGAVADSYGPEKVVEEWEKLGKAIEQTGSGDLVDKSIDFATKFAENLKVAKAAMEEARKEMERLAQETEKGAENTNEMKQAAADLSGRFTGQAIDVKTAAGQTALQSIQTKQLTILERIAQNTEDLNVPVGVP